jgi:hypothetical protein
MAEPATAAHASATPVHAAPASGATSSFFASLPNMTVPPAWQQIDHECIPQNVNIKLRGLPTMSNVHDWFSNTRDQIAQACYDPDAGIKWFDRIYGKTETNETLANPGPGFLRLDFKLRLALQNLDSNSATAKSFRLRVQQKNKELQETGTVLSSLQILVMLKICSMSTSTSFSVIDFCSCIVSSGAAMPTRNSSTTTG